MRDKKTSWVLIIIVIVAVGLFGWILLSDGTNSGTADNSVDSSSNSIQSSNISTSSSSQEITQPSHPVKTETNESNYKSNEKNTDQTNNIEEKRTGSVWLVVILSFIFLVVVSCVLCLIAVIIQTNNQAKKQKNIEEKNKKSTRSENNISDEIDETQRIIKLSSIGTALSSLFFILAIFKIRIIENDKNLIDKIDWLNKMFTEHGSTLTHIMLSTIVSFIIILLMWIFLFNNADAFLFVVRAIINLYPTQLLYILFFSWISPPENAIIEQVFIYGIVFVILTYSYSATRFDGGFGIGIFVSILLILCMIPSFIILLPGWWGIILIGIICIIASLIVVFSSFDAWN